MVKIQRMTKVVAFYHKQYNLKAISLIGKTKILF
jgi:hypothetical protein